MKLQTMPNSVYRAPHLTTSESIVPNSLTLWHWQGKTAGGYLMVRRAVADPGVVIRLAAAERTPNTPSRP